MRPKRDEHYLLAAAKLSFGTDKVITLTCRLDALDPPVSTKFPLAGLTARIKKDRTANHVKIRMFSE